MPQVLWRIPALVSTLDDEALLTRPLLLSGIFCYALDDMRLRKLLAARVFAPLARWMIAHPGLCDGSVQLHLDHNKDACRLLD